MGFIKEKYSDNYVGLIVSFQGNTTTDNYYSGDIVSDAMEHFNLYLDKNNHLRERTIEDAALKEIGLKPQDAAEYHDKITNLIAQLDDETAAETYTILFPQWNGEGVTYTANERIRYNGILYKVLQSHTSQPDWNPVVAVSLFARILAAPTEDQEPATIPDWEQPDSTNGYSIGDEVMYNGIHYRSTVDNNVWSPEAYPSGWKVVE